LSFVWRKLIRPTNEPQMHEPVYERAAKLLEADLGNELVALDVDGGNCFGFNSVATGVWRHLDSPKSFAELKQALLAEYDVADDQCDGELRELLGDLLQKGLIRVTAG
jgi:hypothetical protein